MSYARFTDGDVYVYAAVGGYVSCCGCLLGDKWDFHSPEEIVAHLREHVEAGHKVHDYLLDPGLYPPSDFVAMCSAFMCRKDEGHGGEHSPHPWLDPFARTSPASNAWRCPCGKPREHEIHTPTEQEKP